MLYGIVLAVCATSLCEGNTYFILVVIAMHAACRFRHGGGQCLPLTFVGNARLSVN